MIFHSATCYSFAGALRIRLLRSIVYLCKVTQKNQIFTQKNHKILANLLSLLQIIIFMQIAITNRGSNQIQPEIIKQMNNAQRSIWIAVAWFTDREIYNVLIEKLKIKFFAKIFLVL